MTSELWNLLQRRDVNAAALYLVSQHADEVLGLCRAMVRDQSVAEDLSQDVFGRAFAALADFRGEASSRTWILRIARNRCIDHLRLAQRDLNDDEVSPEDAPAPEPRVDDLLAARGLVRIGLESLDENERALVMLRFGHGMGYAELADTFGLNAGTTRMRISRAVAKMREVLQPEVLRPEVQIGGAFGSSRGARKRSRVSAPGAAAPAPRSPSARPAPPAMRAPPAPSSPSPAAPPPASAPPLPPSPFASVASNALRARLKALAAAY